MTSIVLKPAVTHSLLSVQTSIISEPVLCPFDFWCSKQWNFNCFMAEYRTDAKLWFLYNVYNSYCKKLILGKTLHSDPLWWREKTSEDILWWLTDKDICGGHQLRPKNNFSDYFSCKTLYNCFEYHHQKYRFTHHPIRYMHYSP